MNIKTALLKEHSKKQCAAIEKWVGNDQKRFDELFDLFLHEEYRVVQRAGWPISNCIEQHPALIKKHFARLLKNLGKEGIHDAVKRNTIRLLQFVDIPEKFHGQVMNICFNYINSPSENAAVKAFALTVLDNLSKQYPEIKPELKTIIEDRWAYETAAFHSRARKILKKL